MRAANGSNPTIGSCSFSGNTAVADGGGLYNENSSPMIANSIFWGNSDSGGLDESGQIATSGGDAIVTYSNVQGGWSGSGGAGNINADPLFADADGTDDTVGTEDDDLRLWRGRPVSMRAVRPSFLRA